MNSKKLITGLGIAGGVLGIVCYGLDVYKTVDEIKNGVKLRDDQIDSLAVKVSNNVVENLYSNADVFADKIAERMLASAQNSN